MRGLFVTGTDTGVGKSVVAAAICAALVARGERVAAFKPAVTGLDEPPGEWPPDHQLLAAVANAGQRREDVAPYRFGPPASPHLAAELEGAAIDPRAVIRAARRAGARGDALLCEGVGGLLVPLTSDYLVRDLAVELDLPLVVVARPGLGTISHSLLTVEAARSAGLRVLGVVMTPWPERCSTVARSSRATVERLAETTVSVLPPTRPQRSALAAAGSTLPLAGWLGPSERRLPDAGGSREQAAGSPRGDPRLRQEGREREPELLVVAQRPQYPPAQRSGDRPAGDVPARARLAVDEGRSAALERERASSQAAIEATRSADVP